MRSKDCSGCFVSEHVREAAEWLKDRAELAIAEGDTFVEVRATSLLVLLADRDRLAGKLAQIEAWLMDLDEGDDAVFVASVESLIWPAAALSDSKEEE